jgi:hypothetical protein
MIVLAEMEFLSVLIDVLFFHAKKGWYSSFASQIRLYRQENKQ